LASLVKLFSTGKIASADLYMQCSRRHQILPLVSYWVYAVLASPLPGQLRANMTASTTPEVHSVLHCRQRTEPQPQLTGSKLHGRLQPWGGQLPSPVPMAIRWYVYLP